MADNDDLYHVLGLPRSATPEQIKTAYRRLALRYHPDKGGDAEIFKQVSNAYQILSNPELRRRYDQSLPIPDEDLKSPLEIFQQHFYAWIHQEYPLLEKLIGHEMWNHPLVKSLIKQMTTVESVKHIDLEVSLDQIYQGHPVSLKLNDKITINVPLDHDTVDVDVDVPGEGSVRYHTTIKCVSHDYIYRVGQYDLLTYIDLTYDQLTTHDILTVPFIGGQIMRLKNPKNCNLRQLYRIDKLGIKRRGYLYLYFNLVLCPGQRSLLIDGPTGPGGPGGPEEVGQIQLLVPVETQCLYRKDHKDRR